MKNVKQIWQETAKQLEKVYERREAENIAYRLLEDAFGISKTDILFDGELEVDSDRLASYIKRLLQFEPIQYVTGVADFYGRKFQVAPGSLIPRPETEELVALIIRENKVGEPRILDVGVGSGCIAATLSIEFKVQVFGTDVSREAIAIAEKNSNELGVQTVFHQSDILKENLPESNLDILVSNPPYIPQKELVEMSKNVTEHEPGIALFVPDDDPLIFHKRIAEEGLKALKKGGKLYFEIHENYGDQVKSYLKLKGYSDVKIYQDMQGKERMVCGVKG